MRTLAPPALALLLALACSAPAEPGAGAPADATPATLAAPAPLAPVPSAAQLRWHALETYAFVHFNMNTFTGREWGTGDEDPALFAPEALDCRQWARVCREAGLRGIILTAKHHDGFCLWDSRTTTHDVASSPWRGGQGDVVRELADACRAEGLLLGLYLSPWDRASPVYGDSPRYDDVFVTQLEELLTGYGPLFEVWFDGACGEGPDGRRQVYDWERYRATVRRLQPDAVMFSDVGPDVRWIGNERGFAAETNWGMISPAGFEPGLGAPPQTVLQTGEEHGTHWIPGECDVSIRPGWYWRAEEDGAVKSRAELLEIWHASVGRGANLLLNLPVDRRGLVHENDVARLREWRAALDAIYAEDLASRARASASQVRGGSPCFAAAQVLDGDPLTYWATDDDVRAATLELALDPPVRCDRIRLEEPLALGQRVRAFAVEVRAQGETAWREVARGTTVGAQRVLVFPPVEAAALRVRIEDARACPALATVRLHLAPVAGDGPR
jgi:alpha-L-fucosidase